ncbi:uncharacterized protein LOC143266634 [Megachile rotundata]|uniref:uncharacterized protein LOC143266634 n=1 Tax=Megachile rotundata TaxID=143995 RepID=UPI003FD20C9C
MDMARCLLAEAQVHKCFWPEIICAATYLKNRTLANTIEKKVPYEIFFKTKPNVDHLPLYGSRVFIRKPEQKKLSKWDKKADMGILLGYTYVGYRVLVNRKIVVAGHIEIVERDVKCINLDENDYNSRSVASTDDLSDDSFESTDETEEKQDKAKVRNVVKEECKSPHRFTRDGRSSIRYPENDNYNICVRYCRVDIPCTFEKALSSKGSKNWEEAINKEIECINKNET